MVAINPTRSIIILNLNGLTTSIKKTVINGLNAKTNLMLHNRQF